MSSNNTFFNRPRSSSATMRRFQSNQSNGPPSSSSALSQSLMLSTYRPQSPSIRTLSSLPRPNSATINSSNNLNYRNFIANAPSRTVRSLSDDSCYLNNGNLNQSSSITPGFTTQSNSSIPNINNSSINYANSSVLMSPISRFANNPGETSPSPSSSSPTASPSISPSPSPGPGQQLINNLSTNNSINNNVNNSSTPYFKPISNGIASKSSFSSEIDQDSEDITPSSSPSDDKDLTLPTIQKTLANTTPSPKLFATKKTLSSTNNNGNASTAAFLINNNSNGNKNNNPNITNAYPNIANNNAQIQKSQSEDSSSFSQSLTQNLTMSLGLSSSLPSTTSIPPTSSSPSIFLDKKKVRFSEPLAFYEPTPDSSGVTKFQKYVANRSSPLTIKNGLTSDIKPILKKSSATAALDNKNKSQGFQGNISNPINNTINAINTINNTLTNKTVAVDNNSYGKNLAPSNLGNSYQLMSVHQGVINTQQNNLYRNGDLSQMVKQNDFQSPYEQIESIIESKLSANRPHSASTPSPSPSIFSPSLNSQFAFQVNNSAAISLNSSNKNSNTNSQISKSLIDLHKRINTAHEKNNINSYSNLQDSQNLNNFFIESTPFTDSKNNFLSQNESSSSTTSLNINSTSNSRSNSISQRAPTPGPRQSRSSIVSQGGNTSSISSNLISSNSSSPSPLTLQKKKYLRMRPRSAVEVSRS